MSLFSDDALPADSAELVEETPVFVIRRNGMSPDYNEDPSELPCCAGETVVNLSIPGDNYFEIDSGHCEAPMLLHPPSSTSAGAYGFHEDVNVSLHPARAGHSLAISQDSVRNHVRNRIDEIFESVDEQACTSCQQLTFSLRPIRNVQAQPSSVARHSFTFPGTTAEDSWRFAVVVKMLDLIRDALRDDVTISKRDLFYQDPALFGSQSTIDRYVDSIAAAFGVRRAELNVIAVAKGLIAGAVTLNYSDGSSMGAGGDVDVRLISTSGECLSASMNQVKSILVVEKEATFNSILNSDTWQHVKDWTVMLTGKGYPDFATRHLLRRLAHPSPFNGFRNLPVYTLTDFDPDGIAIANTYKHGSLRLANQSNEIQTPGAQRLGLGRAHIDDGHGMPQTLLPMSTRDRRKAKHLLKRMVDMKSLQQDVADLQIMLMLNIKAELQIVDEVPEGLARLLASVVRFGSE
ncbi:hypothetical protein CAC42_3546 [Sphaceloma murrayae]|uniref:DNA topoisomerase (ATP-hydrolyzing) n=1 Tax=Sphaceloma murrayae TaxID=2082308 RepID=A0A2K1R1P1_9PEZI|nr:hypothetical protein CAC42_3546 [Sphaceloma murrayae]